MLTPAKPYESLTSRHYGLLLTDLSTAPWGIWFLKPTHWVFRECKHFLQTHGSALDVTVPDIIN